MRLRVHRPSDLDDVLVLNERWVPHVARASGAGEVTCEVTLEPPNPDSQAFHARLGFVEVGRRRDDGGTVGVQLLALPVGG